MHGRGSTAAAAAMYLGATQRVDELQFVLVMPDGTQDTEGRLAWNAGASDSVFEPETPDDIAYVLGLIEEAQKAYRLDASRIYLMGSSNGGHLALDILCRRSAQDHCRRQSGRSASFGRDLRRRAGESPLRARDRR